MAIKDNETIFGFDIGNEVNLPVNKTEGRFKITQDTHNMYLDIDEDTRISIGAGVNTPTRARKIVSIMTQPATNPTVEGQYDYRIRVKGNVQTDELAIEPWEIGDIVNLDGTKHVYNVFKIISIEIIEESEQILSKIILENQYPNVPRETIKYQEQKDEAGDVFYAKENWAYVLGKQNGELLANNPNYQLKDSVKFSSDSLSAGWGSAAFGRATKASGNYSMAFGRGTLAGYGGTAGGVKSEATGNSSVALGNTTKALADGSMATGTSTVAQGASSRAGGKYTQALHAHSVAEGLNTITGRSEQFVIGKYNQINEEALLVIGNGTSDINRINIFVVDKNGAYFNNNEIYHSGNFNIENYLGNYYNKIEVDNKLDNKLNITDIISIAQGGTGATNAAAARANLGITLENLGINADAEELNVLNGIAVTTVELNKLKGLQVSATQLNYLSDATSNIQDQLNNIKNALTNDTLTLSLKGNQYYYDGTYGINLNNSDIVGVNGVWFNQNNENNYDPINTLGEGILFKRDDGNNWDQLSGNNGELYFKTNCRLADGNGSISGAYTILHTGNWHGREIGNYNVTFGAENSNTFGNVNNNQGCVMFGGGNKILSTDSAANYIKIFGTNNTASHYNVNLFGTYLTSTASNQTIVGQYNDINSQDIFVVANGLGNNNRKNVFSISTKGATTIQGNLTLTNGSIDLFTANTSGKVYVYKELSIAEKCIIKDSGNIQARSLDIKSGDTNLFKVDSSGNATLYKNVTIGGKTTFVDVISGQGFTTTSNGDIITQGRLWLTGLRRAGYAGKWKCRITVNGDGMVVTDNWTQIEE